MVINEVEVLIRLELWEFIKLKEELLNLDGVLRKNEILYEMAEDLKERFKDD